MNSNPFIQGKQSLLINYLSNKEHSLNYYIYSPTGRLMYQNKVNKPTLEHRYELISQEMMNSFPKQLYIVITVFTSGNEQIKKKRYVVVK